MPASRDRRLRPHRRGEDRRGDRARRAAARARRGPGGRVRRRAAGLRGAADPHRRGRRARAAGRLEHRLLGFVPVDRDVLRRRLRAAGPRGDRPRCSRTAGGRSSSAAPGSTCAPRSPTSTCARRCRARPRALQRSRRPTSTRQLHAARPPRAAAIAPTDRHRLIRTLELLDAGERSAPAGRGRARCGPSTRATRRCSPRSSWTARALTAADRRPHRRDARRRRDATRSGRADAAGASATARAALGFQELLDGDVEAMRTRTRRYAKRQLTWLRKLPGAHLIDVTGRDPGGRRRRADRHDLAPCGSRSGRRWATTTSSSRRPS